MEQARFMVLLNVRGHPFIIPREHLLRVEDSFFSAMLASEYWHHGADGTYFLDVSSAIFKHVLKLLRERKHWQRWFNCLATRCV